MTMNKSFVFKVRVYTREQDWFPPLKGVKYDWHVDYVMPTRDEKGQECLSVKFTVHTNREQVTDPNEWDWNVILGTDKYEIIRVQDITPEEPEDTRLATVECYQCGKRIYRHLAWMDRDGDLYCNEQHVIESMDEGCYRVSPTGRIYNPEEE